MTQFLGFAALFGFKMLCLFSYGLRGGEGLEVSLEGLLTFSILCS